MKGYFMNQLFPECIGCCTTTCGSTYNVRNYYCHSFDILLCFLDVVAKPTFIIAQEVFVLLLSKDFYSTASSRGLLCWSYNKTPSACTEGVPIPIIWVMGNHGGAEGNVPQPGNYRTECAKNIIFSIFYTISPDMSSTRQFSDMLTKNNTSASGCPGSLGR